VALQLRLLVLPEPVELGRVALAVADALDPCASRTRSEATLVALCRRGSAAELALAERTLPSLLCRHDAAAWKHVQDSLLRWGLLLLDGRLQATADHLPHAGIWSCSHGFSHDAAGGGEVTGPKRRTCSAHVLVAGQVREPQRDLVAGAGGGAAVDPELQGGANLGAHEAKLRIPPLLRDDAKERIGFSASLPVSPCGADIPFGNIKDM